MIEFDSENKVQKVGFICYGDPCHWLKKDHFTKRGGGIGTKPQGTTNKVNHYSAWKRMVGATARDAMRDRKGILLSPFPAETPIILRCFIVVPRPKGVTFKKRPYPSVKPDADNFFYLNHNVLEGIVYENDSQIVHLKETKMYPESLHIKPCTMIVAIRYNEEYHKQMVFEFEQYQAGIVSPTREMPRFPI